MRAFKYRIYPSLAQAEAIRQACGCRRFVYNWGLEKKQAAFQNGSKISAVDLINMLPDLKKTVPWLKETNAQSLQTTLRDLDIAFTRFFKRIGGFPTFKKKGKSRESFHIPQNFKVSQGESSIIIPKIGRIKTVFDRTPDGNFKSVTISMSSSGKFFASVLCEQNVDDPKLKPVDPKTTMGLDVGIKTFAVCSDGKRFEQPQTIKRSRSRIEFLSRQLSKKQKGGKNWKKAKIELARAYERLTNQRTDFLHKTSHQLADENQVGTICVEDLNIKGMMQNRCLARRIKEMAWGELFKQLEYKCRWRGIRLIWIGRFEPSSSLCSCGIKNTVLTLKDREWTCSVCGARHDRDLLAAQNIKRFGLAKMGMAAGMTAKNLGSCLVGTQKRRAKKFGDSH